MLIVFLQLCM